MAEDKQLLLEDVRIIFRNFEGRETQFNREGDRNFCVVLPPHLVPMLVADGWNVKYLQGREEGDEPTPILKASVKYKYRPPQIFMISSRNKTPMDESNINVLDWVAIKSVDMILTPYTYSVRGETGISAYVKKMFVTIEEDELDLKYADLEMLPASGGRTVDA